MKQKICSVINFLKRNKAFSKTLSFILSLVILFYVIPSAIYVKAAEAIASIGDGADAAADTASVPDADNAELLPIDPFEVIELREESAKHFRLSDGNYLAAQYNYPVHTLDENGQWQDIDNSLSDDGAEFSNQDARIKFAKQITGNGSLFTLHDGNTKITMSLIGAIKGTVGTVTNNADSEEDTELQKMMTLEKISSKVTYMDVLAGTDLEYVAYSRNVKENIIVKEKKDAYSYSFELKLNGLTAELTEAGDIELRISDTGVLKYSIPAPVVFDSLGNHAPSDVAEYSLTHTNGGKYTLTVTVDSAWMNAEERAFPVTVDPTVVSQSTIVVDTYIDSANPTFRGHNAAILYVTSTKRAYWNISTLPEIPTSANIVEASFKVHTAGAVTSGSYVGVYEVITPWGNDFSSEICASYGDGVLSQYASDYCVINESGEYNFNVIEIVRGWYDTEDGNSMVCGLALNTVPGHSANVQLHSNESAETNSKPALTIVYKDMKGLESYWPYSSHSAGIAGNGNVNLVTGQLVFTIPTLTSTDNIFGCTPTLVYDSSMANKYYISDNANLGVTQSYLGYGFKLNLSETLMHLGTSSEDSYYAYSDPDGTEHYFYPNSDGTYHDEDGLDLTLTIDANQDITITDNANYLRFFDRVTHESFGTRWRLSYIEDPAGNRLVYTYKDVYYAQFELTKISLLPNGAATQIDLLEFCYNDTSGRLTMVYNPSAKIAAVFRYSNGYNGDITVNGTAYLRSVDYAYGSDAVTMANWEAFISDKTSLTNITVYDSAEYSYDSSGRLAEAINTYSGASIKYTWQDSSVTRISEYSGNDLGQELGISYGIKYAEKRSTGNDEMLNTSDDILTRYVLDDYGRAVNVYSVSADGRQTFGGTTGVYDSQEESKNSLKEKTVIGDVHQNILINGAFRTNNPNLSLIPGWTISSNVTGISANIIEYPDSLCLSMSPTQGNEAFAKQRVSLTPGDYTASVHYSVANGENVIGKIEIIDAQTEEVLHSTDLVTYDSSSGVKEMGSLSFSVTSNLTADVKISFAVTGTVSGGMQVRIGNVKLEKSETISEFSFVSAGGFDTELSPADYWHQNTGSITVISDAQTEEEYAKLSANGDESYIRQNIFSLSAAELQEYDLSATFSNSDVQFTVAGYAKAERTLPGKNFRLYAEVTYYYGADEEDVTVIYPFDFAYFANEWQYVQGNFVLGTDENGLALPRYKCVRSVDIVCDYSNQLYGSVYFDNISFTCTGVGKTQMTEYANGLVIRQTNGLDTVFYVYNSDGQVDITADNKGNLIQYTYCGIKSALISTVTECSYEYNGKTDFYPYNNYAEQDNVLVSTKMRTTYSYNPYGMQLSSRTIELTDDGTAQLNGIFSEQTYTYETGSDSKIFGALLSEKNTDYETVYFYDDSTGWLLASFNVDTGNGTAYTYDGAGRLIGVDVAFYSSSSGTYNTYSNAAKVDYEYDAQNRLSSISTSSTEYTLTYDVFGNSDSISIGERELAEYEYFGNNGKQKNILYGNGYEVEYVYNDLELLETVKYRTNQSSDYITAYEYEYTSDGQVLTVKDNVAERVITCVYDARGRFVGYRENTASEHESLIRSDIFYDIEDRIEWTSTTFTYLNGSSRAANTIIGRYSYDNEDKLAGYTLRGNFTSVTAYTYDSLDRLSKVEYNNSVGTSDIDISYTYTYSDDDTYGTGGLIEFVRREIGTSIYTYTYTYNADGNITKIECNDGNVITYTYDNLGQVITEDNDFTGFYYTYTYDSSGNLTRTTRELQGNSSGGIIFSEDINASEITAKPGLPSLDVTTHTYGYTDTEWGDLLTSYDGVTITYDAIGNPLSYYNGSSYTFTWRGRDLIGAVRGSKNMSFVYNDAGLRVSKTVGNTTTYYVYDEDLLLAEYTDTQTVAYIYDANGLPIGFKYRSSSYTAGTWDVYWYEKNLQGDVVAIYNSIGTKLISYKYNAWGVTTETYHNGGSTSTATKNNLTYRGYYYDTDLAMYYLQSRYYDPAICRFINADGEMSSIGGDIRGYNLFAYCMNNPVNMSDHTGDWPRWATIVLGGVAAVAVAAVTALTLGAAAPAAVCTLTSVAMSVGVSYSVASAAATVAVTATTVAAAAYAGDVAYSAVTGDSLLLNTVFQGNTDAYNAGLVITSIATVGMLEMAAQNPGVCFVAGTPVLAACGYIAIEEINAGDIVWAENSETGEKELKKVVQTFVNETTELIYVQVGSEKIVTTPEHPFYSPVKGWIAACELRAGDILVSINGEYVIVENIQHEILEAPISVYNFEVADFHTYYVGKSAVLVHNTCGEKQTRTSPNQMQKQVERGQAPSTVVRVDNPKISGQLPHIHFSDGTAINIDGSVHDSMKGEHVLTNSEQLWIFDNGWGG